MGGEMEDPSEYFSVDLPGLSRKDAAMLVAAANDRRQSVGGYVVDPAEFLTMHLDASTVRGLAAAVQYFIAQYPPASLEHEGLNQLLEDMNNWEARFL